MLWCLSAFAADLWVGPGLAYTNLTDASLAAGFNDRVLLVPGTYDVSLEVPNNLTVIGIRGAAVTTVRRASAGVAIFEGEGDTLVVRGLTLDGRGDSPVIALETGSTLLVHQSRLLDGSTDTSGSCIGSRSSDVVLTNSLVENCASDIHAGVYSAFGDVEVRDTIFRGNSGSSGGGLTCLDSGCEVTGSLFEGNVAVRGGGMMIWETDATLTRSVFCGNLATAEGGGVRIRHAAPLLSGLVFIDNDADFNAGQISVSDSGGAADPTLEHLTLLGGTVDIGEGAALQLEGASSTGFLDNSLLGRQSGSVDVFLEDGATLGFGTNWTWGNPGGDPSGDLTPMNPDLVDDNAGCVPASWTLSSGSPAIGAAGGTDMGATGGATPLVDADGDGHFPPWDCDDADEDVFPGAPELCNDRDDNCDFEVDDGMPRSDHFRDEDGDGHGSGTAIRLCDAFWDLVPSDDDCDDGNGGISPSSPESCNGFDDDCDGDVDEGLALTSYWPDTDGDGFGAGDAVLACTAPSGHVEDDTDCDDSNASVSPVALEMCTGIDDDCDGTIDEEAADEVVSWRDADGDGFGDPADSVEQCETPMGYVLSDEDCNDADPAVFPGADELCNGADDDCDGDIDEDAIDAETRFADEDGDGFGDPESTLEVCPDSLDGVTDATDCDDTRADVNPDAAEEPGNTVDEDCDGENALTYSDDDNDQGAPVDRKSFCGCGSSGSPVLWLVAPMVLLLARRR